MSLFENLSLPQEVLTILGIDLAIAVLLLTAMRYLQGWSINVNSSRELAERDNFAFGVSTAGAVLALGIVLTGSITGAPASDYMTEAMGVAAYGLFGMLLIKVGRVMHDKIALNNINKNTLILKGNVSVALVDGAAAVATAIIIRASLLWVDDLTLDTFIAITSAFLVAQFMLVLLTRMRENRFASRNQGACMQDALAKGHTAVAIRHAGHMIAMALSFNAASHFVIYSPTGYVSNLLGWFSFSVITLLSLTLLLSLVKILVLARIRLADEIERQHNVGLAAVEVAISISIALILNALMA